MLRQVFVNPFISFDNAGNEMAIVVVNKDLARMVVSE